MTSKHTAGPWHWHTSRTLRHLQDASGSCFAGVSMPSKTDYDADAKLISLAPEMAEALRGWKVVGAAMLQALEMQGGIGARLATELANERDKALSLLSRLDKEGV